VKAGRGEEARREIRFYCKEKQQQEKKGKKMISCRKVREQKTEYEGSGGKIAQRVGQQRGGETSE